MYINPIAIRDIYHLSNIIHGRPSNSHYHIIQFLFSKELFYCKSHRRKMTQNLQYCDKSLFDKYDPECFLFNYFKEHIAITTTIPIEEINEIIHDHPRWNMAKKCGVEIAIHRTDPNIFYKNCRNLQGEDVSKFECYTIILSLSGVVSSWFNVCRQIKEYSLKNT